MDAIIIYQLIGFIGLGVSCVAFAFACPKVNLSVLAGSGVLWGIHHLALGNVAYIVGFLSAIRNICGATFHYKHVPVVVYLYIPIVWVLSFYFLNNIYDLLPAVATTFGSLTILLREKPFLYRCACFFAEINWVLYGILVMSYAVILGAAMLMMSVAIAMARFDLPVMKKVFLPKKSYSDHFRQASLCTPAQAQAFV